MAKQSGGNTAQRVEALVRPTVEGMGLRLWDVVFEKEGPDWYLRVLIDKDGTMDTDTCAEVSHALDPILDEADPIDQSYYLEVGSPGLGRNCRFTPSRSQYMLEAIQTHGCCKGLLLGAWRIARCNPLGRWGYDPVPPKGKWVSPERKLSPAKLFSKRHTSGS